MKQGFSIIIPTYNTLPYLKLCLKSFKERSAYPHQIIVCADGCSDGTNEFLKTYPGIDYLILDKNQGICSATNLAALKADREYLFLANDDLAASPGWDQALMSQANPARVLSCVQVEPGWVPVAPCHIKKDFGRTSVDFREQEFLKFAAAENSRRQGFTEPGANYPFLIQRELWKQLGGLDERFNPGPGSDPDLFYRLALDQKELLRVRSCLFYHFGGRASRFAGESGQQSRAWKKAAVNSRRIFALKWGRPWDFAFGQAPKINRPDSLIYFVWGGIGNMIMALPAIGTVRKSLPDAKITVVAQKQAMLQLLPPGITDKMALDELMCRGFRGLWTLAQDLRKFKPRTTFSSQPFPKIRYGLMALASGAKNRVCPIKQSSLCCSLKIQESSKHYLERNLELLRAAGLDRKFQGYGLTVTPGEAKQANEYLTEQKIDISKLIGLHPGAGHPRKRWSRDNFISLGKALAGQGHSLLVFGGPDEKELAEYVSSNIGSGTGCWAGTQDLRATLAAIRNCRAFISNDSGLAHCAAALGIPTIAIFGPTDPGSTRPYGPLVKIVQASVKCGPCYRPAGKFGCRDAGPPCLSRISPDLVFREFQKINRPSKAW